jgi:hypothetical protein
LGGGLRLSNVLKNIFNYWLSIYPKYYRCFGAKIPSKQDMEKDEGVSFIRTIQRNEDRGSTKLEEGVHTILWPKY